jgi:lauroyl/myristoyl acyltransferase
VGRSERLPGSDEPAAKDYPHAADDSGVTGHGATYHVRFGGRLYTIRPGFAELALNTGAAIVPVFGRFDEQGRLLLKFHAAFDAGRGTRAQQIESLMRQYEAFAESVIREHTEILNWKKMRNHLKLPPAVQA